MSKIRRIDWSPSEWLAGTRGLGMDETAVYITVLNIIYDRADACPNDASFIGGQMTPSYECHSQARSAITRRTAIALGSLIKIGKLHVSTDGHWLTNGRADIELNKARERIGGTVRAGIASGRARRRRGGPAALQQHSSSSPAMSEINNSNGLARTGVRIINHHMNHDHESDHKISTDAARDPTPEPQAASGRALTGPDPFEGTRRPPAPSSKTAERMAALAAAARAKFLEGK